MAQDTVDPYIISLRSGNTAVKVLRSIPQGEPRLPVKARIVIDAGSDFWDLETQHKSDTKASAQLRAYQSPQNRFRASYEWAPGRG